MEIVIKDFTFLWPGETHPLLDIPYWSLKSGAQALIWGESGKGKTTLLHCIGGLLQATKGEVIINGLSYREMNEKDRHRLRRDEFTMVFQRLNLLKHLTTLENVMLGINRSWNQGKTKAMHALERVGMHPIADRLAWHLSAGEQQRTALARTFVRNTPLTMVDEPTANLDKANAIHVIEELLSEVQQRNHTLIVVSHDERIRPLFDLIYNIEEISQSCPV